MLCSEREDLRYIYEGENAKVHISEHSITCVSVIYNDYLLCTIIIIAYYIKYYHLLLCLSICFLWVVLVTGQCLRQR